MSQADLAEALDVSRQSVSKWETDTAVPDLDKIVNMSELFGVTLDEFIKGDLPVSLNEMPQITIDNKKSEKPYKTPGIIMLSLGVFFTLLILVLTGSLGGIFLSLPFLICGVICLSVKKRGGLWCAWVFFVWIDLYLRFATGTNWRIIFRTIGYKPEWNYMSLAIGWAPFLVCVILVIFTVRSFKNTVISWNTKLFPIVGGWLVLGGLSFLQSGIIEYLHSLPYEEVNDMWYYFIRSGGDYICLALLIGLLILSRSYLRNRE